MRQVLPFHRRAAEAPKLTRVTLVTHLSLNKLPLLEKLVL
jgi:hypothetical protein